MLDRQIHSAPEIDCAAQEHRPLRRIQPKRIERYPAFLDAERALARRPPRGARLGRAVIETRRHVPAAKFHIPQFDAPVSIQCAKKLIPSDAFRRQPNFP